MSIQLTFQRGHYTGNWVADEPATPDHPVDDLMGSIFTPLGKAISGIIPEELKVASGNSGSLEILYKGVQEIVLYNKSENEAEEGFLNYVVPDTKGIAWNIVDDQIRKSAPYQEALKQLATDDRYIQDDIDSVRGNIKILLERYSYDTSEFDVQ